MRRSVFGAFLKAVVPLDVVEVVSAGDSGSLHLHLRHHTRQHPPSDGDITSKEAVSVGALYGAQTDVFVVWWELLLAIFSK